ncbi:MAG: class D beta-lactamase [Magnetococcales bacterium]|nr:class D beta-lactamase [Magnetococcales bacterium]
MGTRTLGFIVGLFSVISSAWSQPETAPPLATLLEEAGVSGCIVLHNLQTQHTTVSSPSTCQERSIPASTFKITNLLIALETEKVQEDAVFPWDGTQHSFKAWNQDLNLADAMKVSAVPVFQRIAKRIGLDTMEAWVSRLGYGNQKIGTQVDRFWLDGPLSISPVEQAGFMERVSTGQLPVSKRSFQALKRLMPQEDFNGGVLYGKTGWGTGATPPVGWYVGWFEKDETLTTFAVRINMPSLKQAPLRISLAKAALEQRLPMPQHKPLPNGSE